MVDSVVGGSRRRARWLAVGVAALAGALVLAPGGEAKSAERTAIYDLFGTAQVKPKKMFLTASSGPYLKQLEWKGWGERRAVGTGTYVSDCASCPPPDRRPAKVILRKLRPCERQGGNAYKVGRLRTRADYSGERKTVPLEIGFWYCRKRS